jgi:hypothetical protein
MGSIPDDRVVPGSEKAYETVNDRHMREIVRDLYHGPASLPLVSPQPHPVGSGWVEPAPLKPYEGAKHVDAVCDAFEAQDKLTKISEMLQAVAALQPDAKIKRLEAEVERLKAELAKVKK